MCPYIECVPPCFCKGGFCLYIYDACGNILSVTGSLASTVGQINPFRYRGYYYDSETELYYLNSRYYDAEVGRFISADNVMASVSSTLDGYNLFAYCFNNPINMADDDGNWPRWITAVAAGVLKFAAGVSALAGSPTTAMLVNTAATITSSAYVIQSLHYDLREKMNEGVPKTYQEAMKKNGADNSISADCHQFTAKDTPNKKVCWPDGTEGIYNGNTNEIVTDSKDIGTYNLFVPKDGFTKSMHAIFDVAPWVIFGNSDSDPGPIINYPEMWIKQIAEVFN